MARATTSVAMALAVVAAVLLSSGLLAGLAGANFISSACTRTQDAALCVAVLSADPRSGRASSVRDLADIALDIAADTATENLVDALSLKTRRRGTPAGDAASVCGAAYYDAANELRFHERRISFDTEGYGGVSRLVASAQGAADRCQDAFKLFHAEESAVVDMNRQMTERCAIARGLLDLLASSSSSSCCCCSSSTKISYLLCTLFFSM